MSKSKSLFVVGQSYPSRSKGMALCISTTRNNGYSNVLQYPDGVIRIIDNTGNCGWREYDLILPDKPKWREALVEYTSSARALVYFRDEKHGAYWRERSCGKIIRWTGVEIDD